MQAVELFEKGMTVRARVSFLYAGVVYKPGDLFDYKKINADWNRVRLLFDQRKLEIVSIADVVVLPKERVKDKKVDVVEEEEEEDVEIEEETEETDTAPISRRKRSRRK